MVIETYQQRMCENPIVMVPICKQTNTRVPLRRPRHKSRSNLKAQEFGYASLDEVVVMSLSTRIAAAKLLVWPKALRVGGIMWPINACKLIWAAIVSGGSGGSLGGGSSIRRRLFKSISFISGSLDSIINNMNSRLHLCPD